MTLQLVAQQLMQSLTHLPEAVEMPHARVLIQQVLEVVLTKALGQQLQVYFIVLDITFLCHRITFSLNIFDNVLNREII